MARQLRSRILVVGVLVALLAFVVVGTLGASAASQSLTPAVKPLAAPAAPDSAQDAVALANAAIERLLADTGGSAKVSRQRATDVANFVRLQPGSLRLPVGPNASAEDKAASFFGLYGAAFGIRDASQELTLISNKTDHLGATLLVYQQTYRGVPVWAGRVRVHLNAAGELTVVNGVFIPGIALSASPMLDDAAAASIAVAEVVARPDADDASVVSSLTAADLTVAENALYVYHDGLAQGIGGSHHLVYEIEVRGPGVREFVFINAQVGNVVERYGAIHNLINRRIFEISYDGTPEWQEGQPFPTANVDWNNEIDGAGETYNIFGSMTNGAYLSYDGLDAMMETVNNDPNISCPNANWNGTTTNYCTGVTGDDTVSHEWGHAYTDFTHDLIYAWQPGALNESYSDIWGEVADELNARGLDEGMDGPRAADGSACSTFGQGTPSTDASYRWLSGEDDPAFGGAIRDMWRPECYNDPGRVTSASYACSTGDSGGVHSNSGVPNHAFALLVDGGTYNSQTVTGIGWVKAAHIYWRAQTTYQDQASDFAVHADALEASCSDLQTAGTQLFDLEITGPGTWGTLTPAITAGDCAQLAAAIAATELRTEPTQCGFVPMLNPNAPALCAGGTVTGVYSDTFETDPTSTWTLTNYGVNPEYLPRDWEWVTGLPDGRAGSAMFMENDIELGNCVPGDDDQSGAQQLTSPAITIPAGVASPLVAFDHWVSTEGDWDGGNLKVRVNGGAWTVVPASAFTFNAYNDTLNTSGAGNTNPLAGEAAWTGSNGGDVRGSWGQSQVDLTGIATAGDTVELQYDFGVDGCNGRIGWYVDNVNVYACAAPTAIDLNSLGTSRARPLPVEGLAAGLMLLSLGTLAILRRRRR